MQRSANNNLIKTAKESIESHASDARKQCRILMEKMFEDETSELSDLLKYYSLCYSKPILGLTHDIQRQASMYQNLLEEIKRYTPNDVLNQREDATEANQEKSLGQEVKAKYEKLGLIPEKNLPNPSLESICEYATEKLSIFGQRLLELLARYGKKFAEEANFEAGITGTLQVEVGWGVGLTVGIDFSTSAS